MAEEAAAYLEADLRAASATSTACTCGGITIVKDYVLARRLRQLEVFVPLRHDPGHAQADFGEAVAEIAGVEHKIHFFAVDLPHSDACLCRPLPRKPPKRFNGTTPPSASSAAYQESILYDDAELAVARILAMGRGRRTRVFGELQSHGLYQYDVDPGEGNDKARSKGWSLDPPNLLVPVPRAASSRR